MQEGKPIQLDNEEGQASDQDLNQVTWGGNGPLNESSRPRHEPSHHLNVTNQSYSSLSRATKGSHSSRGTLSKITINNQPSMASSLSSQPSQPKGMKFEISNGTDIEIDQDSEDGDMMDVENSTEFKFQGDFHKVDAQRLQSRPMRYAQEGERVKTKIVIGDSLQESQDSFHRQAAMVPPIHQSTVYTNELLEHSYGTVEPSRMEIEDILPKAPLVVMDGANVAYAYTHASGAQSSLAISTKGRGGIEPDSIGIKIAVKYFVSAGCRVLVVLPQHWMRRKPNPDAGFHGTF